MRVSLVFAAATLILPAASAAAADEARAFAPSADWAVQGDGESCWISRQFGSSDGVTFALQAFSPGATSYNTILRGDPLPHRDAGALEFEFRFGPDPGARPATGVLGGGRVPRLTFVSSLESTGAIEAMRTGERPPAAIDSAREAAVDEFVIAFSRGRPLSLQLGSMAEPLARLRECTARLPERWGLDPMVQRSLSRAAVPIEMDTWLGPGSYPWEYLRNALSVYVHLRLMTDEQGAVSQCIVQSPQGQTIAGAVACRAIMAAAKFEPALDAAGNPVRSYFTTSIFYHTQRSNGPLRGQSRTQGL